MATDADIYSLFMGAPDAAQQAQAMAEALRRRREGASLARNAGNVALLTGDRVLGQFGQAQLQQAGQGMQEVGQGEGMLAQAGSQGAGRALQEALAQRQAEQHAAGLEMRRRELGESAAARKEDRLLRALTLKEAAAERTAARQDKAAAAEAKKQEEAAGLRVPGFERVEGGPLPRDVEVTSMRAKVEAEDRMNQLFDAVEKAKETGREAWPSFLGNPDIARQRGTATNLLLGLKALEATGALDSGTVEVAEPLIPGKTDSKEVAAAKLAEFRNLVRTGVEAKAKSLGYRRAGPAPGSINMEGAPASAAPSATGGRTPVRDKKGKLLGYINADGTEDLVE